MERWPDWLQDLDERAFLSLNAFLHRGESEGVENFMRFVNALGTWPAALLLLVIVALVGKTAGARMRRFCETGLACGLAFAGASWIKGWVAHARPRLALEAAYANGEFFEAFGENLRSRSFPSGHTTTAFALAVLLAVWSKGMEGASPWRRPIAVVAAFTFASMTGLARIYSGSHFPLDVLAGAALGSLAAALALWIVSALAGPRVPAPPMPGPTPPVV